ncbi:MAG TPA: DegT/DnrJ/EryC1/StrS family aminotransferase [Planctomycetota bacterium]|nr:DegT/DnrJ/EryC1/StrS family aminotransferase [Planctomycetota bacterium]
MEQLKTLEAAPPEYPPAKAPSHPVLSTGTLGLRRGVPSVLDAGRVVHTVSGRMALALALERLGIGRGARVLLPGYHCTAIVEPLVHAGAVPVFYAVRRDLSVDLDDLARKADGARALLAIHYFGFPQNMTPLRAFCDARGIALIEDCAHAFFGHVGAKGDVAIASTWKFFAVQEGGCLIVRGEAKGLRGPGLRYEAKSMVNALERSWEMGRLPVLRAVLWPLFALKDRLRDRRAAPARGTDVPTGGHEFDESWVGRRPSRFTRFVLALSNCRRIARRRRENYAFLLEGLRGLPGTRALFPALPEGVVPYVFPLLVEDERVFPRLKRSGVPIVRFGELLWDGVDDPVALEYSRTVLQFPCHQEMTRKELTWIVAQVRDAAVRQGDPR